MNVAMIVHAYYLKDARVRRYAELLADKSYNVDVLCLNEGSEPKSETVNGVNIHRVGIARLRGGKLSYVAEYLSSFVMFLLKLTALTLKGNRYQIVHVHNMPNFLVYAAVPQKLRGAKVVLDIHDPMAEVFQSKYGVGEDGTLSKVLRLEEKISAWFADALIAANHAFKDIVGSRACSEDKISVVMNAPNEAFTKYASQPIRESTPHNDFHVNYIGTLAERYGVDIGIEALGRLYRDGKIPNLRFTIIPKIMNEGDYQDYLVRRIAECGLSDCFELLDPVPHADMPSVIEGIDLSLYTPLPDVHMDIALSLKIPEIIAIGRPAVTSRIEVLERYFGDESLFMFEPGNVEECAEQILKVYSDKQEVARRAKIARDRLEQISWDKQSDTYLGLIDRLAA